ncbi:MAG: flagellar basal-body rod protein FlgB [Candidatus Endobugula sp.]
MIEDLSGVTSKVVTTTLDGLFLRHQVIAHNIANVNTPNYSAKGVSFEQHLDKLSLSAASPSEKQSLTDAMSNLKGIIQEKNSLIFSTGNKVELDKEMVQLTENVLKFRALLEANSRRGDIMSLAIKGRSN